MKVKNVWWVGLIVYLIYNAIIFTSWAAVGADYRNMVGYDVAFKNLIISLGLGAIFMTAAVYYLRWWRPSMVEDRRGGPAWVLPVLLVVLFIFLGLLASTTNWSELAAGHLIILIIAAVLVGYNEELLVRGVLVVAWRGSTSNEVWVWFCTTALFGLMHLPNAFFGIGLFPASTQAVFAFLLGSGLYLLRRLSGSLLLPILVHGTWDFLTFTNQASGAEMPGYVTAMQLTTYLASFALVIIVLRAGQRSKNTPQTNTP